MMNYRSLIAIFLLVLLGFLAEPVSFVDDSFCHLSGRDSISASIGVKGGIYYSKGFPVGFQYELLSRYADDMGLFMDIDGAYDKDESIVMLVNGDVDIAAFCYPDSLLDSLEGSILLSRPVNDFVWGVRRGDDKLLASINLWLGVFESSNDFIELRRRFFRSYSVKEGQMTRYISPYDEIVKKYSKGMEWDWRLLSAIICKESRFAVSAASKRGAMGLMQVVASTADHYGVINLLDPEQNVKAGTSHLISIKRRYERMGLDSVNVVKFTLAAYNAGESRIDDCIAFTFNNGGNGYEWEDVAGMIPLMSDEKLIGEAGYLTHGLFKGKETIRYVSDVLSLYDDYCKVVFVD